MIVVDSFLSKEDFIKVYFYCYNEKYIYGEKDNPHTPITGMIHVLEDNNDVYKLIDKSIKDKDLIDKNSSVKRMYINCFAPGENPYYHRDDSEWTFLLYINEFVDINNNGETLFVDETTGELKGILPLQNRLVKFKGDMLHKATSNRNDHRFTLAIKY